MNKQKLKTPSFYDSRTKIKNIDVDVEKNDLNFSSITQNHSITPTKLNIINQEDLYGSNRNVRNNTPPSNYKNHSGLKEDAR